MKTVSLREFQLNANKFLREGDFPILLTRYNLVVAQVIPNGTGVISQEQFDDAYNKVIESETSPKKFSKKISEIERLHNSGEIGAGTTTVASVPASDVNSVDYGFKLCKAKFCNKFAEDGDFCKEHK